MALSLPLPLLKRVTEDGVTFVLSPVRPTPTVEPSVRMPTRAPGPGEQYRFHFDMGKCIDCKCCVVACNEQNANPAASTGAASERGVVSKCDLCHSRPTHGQAPACVSACPSGAIQVEIVNVADWKAAVSAPRPAPGVPTGDQSLSTTRITLPRHLAPNARPVDLVRLALSEAHWSLILMTTLTQLSVGTLATVWLLQLLGASTALGATALTSVLVGGLALTASTLHLGRPIHAYRALKMWKRSWLSREVLLFTAFSVVACVYAAALWLSLPGPTGLGALTAAFGLGGVTASAYIYRVPSRPAWNTPFTMVHFHLTAATLGPLFAAAVGAGDPRLLGVATAAMAGAQLATLALRFFRLAASDGVELRAPGTLLATTLASRFVLRGVLLALGAIALPLFTVHPAVLWLAFIAALAGEFLGRYLFFVSAVPKHMVAPYLGSEAA